MSERRIYYQIITISGYFSDQEGPLRNETEIGNEFYGTSLKPDELISEFFNEYKERERWNNSIDIMKVDNEETFSDGTVSMSYTVKRISSFVPFCDKVYETYISV